MLSVSPSCVSSVHRVEYSLAMVSKEMLPVAAKIAAVIERSKQALRFADIRQSK